MKRIIYLLLALSILSVAPAHAAILVFTGTGSSSVYTTKLTLESARTAADCAGKTIVITSALTLAQSNISGSWPADRALEIKGGGSIANSTAFTLATGAAVSVGVHNAFKGAGLVTGLREGSPVQWKLPGDTDDTASIKKAIACKPSKINFLDKYYIVSDSLDWDVFRTSWIGANATIAFNIPAAAKWAIKTVSTGNTVATQPFTQTPIEMRGIKLISTGATECNGILFDYPAGSGSDYNGPSFISVSKVSYSYFKTAAEFRTNAFNLTHNDSVFFANDLCVSVPAGAFNYGERIAFIGCNFNNSVKLFDVQDNAAVHLSNCSLDYPSSKFITLESGGQAYLDNCHIEGDPAGWNNIPPFTITDEASNITISGGKIVWKNTTHAVPYLFQGGGSANTNSGVTLVGVFLANVKPTSGMLASGVHLKSYNTSTSMGTSALLTGSEQNLMQNPTWSGSNLSDIFVSNDGANAITSKKAVGVSIKAEFSADYSYSSTRSLKVMPIVGDNAGKEITIAVPVTPGTKIGARYRYKKGSAGAGTIYLGWGWSNFGNDGYTMSGSSQAVQAFTFAAATTSWADFVTGISPLRVPAGMHYIYFTFEASEAPTASLYVDELVVTEF